MSNMCFPLEKMEPIMNEVLESGGEFKMIIRGTSMLPLLRQGKDTVVLVKHNDTYRKNDVILYKRSNSSFVLHRIIGKNKSGYILCGDNQFKKEKGITYENIIAVMTAFVRDGKRIEVSNARYKGYLRTLFFRRKYKLFRYICSGIKNRIFGG